MKAGVNVILPESTWGTSLASRPRDYRYPVLWLQSGGGFDYTDWQRYTSLELYASEVGIAVVCSGTYCSGYMDTVISSIFLSCPLKPPRWCATCSLCPKNRKTTFSQGSPWGDMVP